MRILVLTGDKLRHRFLVKRLIDKGHRTLAWSEAKGQCFNEPEFESSAKVLLQLHSNLLKQSFSSLIMDTHVDIEMNTFKRGSFSDDRLVGRIKEFQPEIILTYGCGIVGESIIELYPHRVIGSHQGLPQYYRGSGSNFFAFLNEESCRMGVSIHLLDAGIDTGPVIAQSSLEPSISDTYYSYSAKLIMETINLYVNVIDRLEKKGKEQLNSIPLFQVGRLYQRKDFIPEVLEKMMYMQLKKTFETWYVESIERYGKPLLIG
jgi:folate-dependent phosphoribosylglycinamide formyltransferase PurN